MWLIRALQHYRSIPLIVGLMALQKDWAFWMLSGSIEAEWPT